MIKLTKSKCPANHPCPLVRMCPQNAITQKGFAAPDLDHDKCVECGICVNNCGYGVFENE